MKHEVTAALVALTALTMLNGCVPLVVAGGAGAATTVAQERSIGAAIDDAGIVTKINNKFAQSQFEKLFMDIDVDSIEGRVMLTGKAINADVPIEAVKLAWEVQGVKEVINEIQVTDRRGITNYTKDAWLTSRIKSQFLVDKDIRSINYNVETVNGTVYLMGLAQSQAELDKVVRIVRNVSGVTKVISHVRLKDDARRTQ